MNIQFENDYQHKIMMQAFPQETVITSRKDVLHWRSEWMQALKSWHSPYKALIDCTNITIDGDHDVLKREFELMMKFLSGFFLRKAAGFGFDEAKGHDVLPFPVEKDQDAAAKVLGIRSPRAPADPSDFRGTIQFQNHFRQHVIELNFSVPVVLDSSKKVATLKSKLLNNLMQWHSKWSFLIDCSNLEISPEVKPELQTLEQFLRGFFMKDIVGYSPRASKETYPFDVFRSRHRAAARLEHEGSFSGDDANCRSRQSAPS